MGTIAQSLGRIGDRAAYMALQRALSASMGGARAQAVFALRLIAHRLDLELPESPKEAPALVHFAPSEVERSDGPCDPM